MFRVIAAHPRSGQNYISRVMRDTGLMMGVGYTRGDGTRYYADDPPCDDGAVSFVGIRYRVDMILHQVRDPLRTIASSTTEPAGTYRLLFKTLRKWPVGKRYENYYHGSFSKAIQSPLLPMWTWIHLNEEIEKHAVYRYRIEDIDIEYPIICEWFQVEAKPEVPAIARNFNHRPHREFTWDELAEVDKPLTEHIRRKAKEYGYD